MRKLVFSRCKNVNRPEVCIVCNVSEKSCVSGGEKWSTACSRSAVSKHNDRFDVKAFNDEADALLKIMLIMMRITIWTWNNKNKAWNWTKSVQISTNPTQNSLSFSLLKHYLVLFLSKTISFSILYQISLKINEISWRVFWIVRFRSQFCENCKNKSKISNIFLNLDSFLLIWTNTLKVCQWTESLDALNLKNI